MGLPGWQTRSDYGFEGWRKAGTASASLPSMRRRRRMRRASCAQASAGESPSAHTEHRGATCITCHPGTYAAPGPVLVEKEPVQILGIESCRACHSPLGTRVTLPDKTTISGGGVRYGCTDCHGYHNGDHGLQGRGAQVGFPAKPRDLSDFLRGK